MSDVRGNQREDRRRYRIAGSAPMTGMSGHVDDLAGAYALGALEAAEAAHVDAHLRGCVTCERAVDDALRTVAMLPFLAPRSAPPPDTKVALFSRIAHAQNAAVTASLPRTMGDAFRTPTLPSSAGLAVAMPLAAPAPLVAESQTTRTGRSGWLATVLSMPLLIALIATGFWGVQLRDQLGVQTAQLTDMQAELANFGSGTTAYPLSPGGAAPQAEGTVVMGSDGRGGMLKIDVNSDEGARSFEMWANQGDRLVRVAEVTVNQDGQGQARFELDQPFGDYESVHIKAKAVDPTANSTQSDTLLRDNNGSLGSTGSGLDLIP